ncbi:MAG: G1 family glutamic endopeptidase [Acidimicrobiales bacterium]
MAWQPEGETAHLVPTVDPHATGVTNAVEESYNWSGYVDTGPIFTAISAQWVVPTVQPSQSAQYSSTWIGIDGFPPSDTSLIQTGTAQQTSGGVTSYYDWEEIITPSDPAPAVTIGAVSPGDHMTASIYEVTAGTWMMAITDVTSGSVYAEPFAYSGTGGSAEWIEEAPTVGGGQSTLADFGSASFSNMADTNSGSPAVTPTQLDMVSSSNVNDVIATPGSIANNAFTITYTGPVPAPPVVQPTTTTVSVTPSSSTLGTAVTYSASVASASGTPTGSVTFTAGTTTLCTTGALVGGSASCSTSTAPEGTDTVTGSYSGSSSFTASSGTATLVVSAPPPVPTPTPPPTPTPTPSPTPTQTPTPSGHGYWLVGSDGGIFTFGAAQFYGSTGALTLQRPVVGITPTANDGGYWLVASDGGIFSFGNAGYYGSIPRLGFAPAGSTNPKRLNAPIVGMVPSADGAGYFMVASDGGVFAFGDAKFEGSCPSIGGCAGAAVAVMPDASGNGYWLVTATGHVYAFGDAVNYGAPGPQSVPVTAAVRTHDGAGYWLLFANGVVAPYGDAADLGGPAGAVGGLDPASAIFSTSDGGGYWVTSANGSVYTYGDAPNDGSMAGQHLNGSIVAATGW